MSDVNGGAGAAPEGSSPSQGQSTSEAIPSSSAGTENTESEWQLPETNPGWPDGIYNRFKGLNGKYKETSDKYKTLEEKWKSYEGKEDVYKTYEQFDNILSQRPDLMNLVQIGLQNPQVAQAILQQIGAVQGQQQVNPQEQQISGLMQSQQQLVQMTYLNEFSRLASEAKIPQELMSEYMDMTKTELLKLNQNPLANLNLQILQQAFVKAQERANRLNAPYRQSKQADGVPASASRTGMQPFGASPDLKTQNDTSNFFAQKLKASLGM